MSSALERIGATPEEIRRGAIMSGWRPPPPVPPHLRYLEGDQRTVWERVRRNEPVFFALALMEVPAATIAAIEGVSAECVLTRLRPRGLAGSRGRRTATAASFSEARLLAGRP
jgi:hypothetical protein